MGAANAIKKLDAEVKRSKEEVENMDTRSVYFIPPQITPILLHKMALRSRLA